MQHVPWFWWHPVTRQEKAGVIWVTNQANTLGISVLVVCNFMCTVDCKGPIHVSASLLRGVHVHPLARQAAGGWGNSILTICFCHFPKRPAAWLVSGWGARASRREVPQQVVTVSLSCDCRRDLDALGWGEVALGLGAGE